MQTAARRVVNSKGFRFETTGAYLAGGDSVRSIGAYRAPDRYRSESFKADGSSHLLLQLHGNYIIVGGPIFGKVEYRCHVGARPATNNAQALLQMFISADEVRRSGEQYVFEYSIPKGPDQDAVRLRGSALVSSGYVRSADFDVSVNGSTKPGTIRLSDIDSTPDIPLPSPIATAIPGQPSPCPDPLPV